MRQSSGRRSAIHGFPELINLAERKKYYPNHVTIKGNKII